MNCKVLEYSCALWFALMLCSCQQARLKRVRVEAPPVGVKVMIVSESGNISQRSYVGTVQSSKEVTVSAAAMGTLQTMAVRQGSRLNEGDIIAVINSPSVESTLAAAKASAAQAKDGLDRAEKLYAAGSIPEVKLVEVQTRYQQAQASLSAAENACEECTIRAPYACSVVQVYANAGEKLMPAQVLATLMDRDAIEVVIPVPEAELANIAVGTPAKVVFPSIPAADEFEKSFRARVKSKALVSSDISHTFKCTLELRRHPDAVVSGMACKVYLEQDDVKGIVVPVDVVKMDDHGRYVWTVEGGIVKKNMVETGGYSGKGVIIRKGLEVGDMLIVDGASKVSTGMHVNVMQ